MTSPITLPVREGDGDVRLDRFLRRKFPHLGQGRIEQMIRKGLIRIDGTRAKKASDRLSPGMDVFAPPGIVIPDKADDGVIRTRVSPEDEQWLRNMVIHEDEDMIVLNKPAGIPVQGGTGQTRSLDKMMDVFTLDEHGKPKLCHRLDKDTSGVLVFGRTPSATAKLAKAFAGRKTTKIYWAICLGVPHPMSGEIRGFMKKAGSSKNPDMELMQTAAHGDPEGQFAITDFEVISHAGTRASWVAMKPVTGRTHQLRFHMQQTGCPIAGDPKYKNDREQIGGLAEQLHLHARAIKIPHPRGGMLTVVADLPTHMAHAFDTLGFSVHESKDPFSYFRVDE
jgi:23S rRNA pseudouridine955/2504/2580 synthase